jgi:hypothetical protein
LLVSPAGAIDPSILANETGPYIHYSYSALFGSGVYRLDDRTVTTLRVVPSIRLRETTRKKPGIRLVLPMTAGWHNFDFGDLGDLLEEPAATLTVLPGVQLEYQLNERWSLRPAVYAGAGFDFDNDETNLVYGAALRTTYDLGGERMRRVLGGEFLVGGHVPTDGVSKFIPRAGVGLDLIFPTGWQLGQGEVFINTQFIGYGYFDELSFETLGPEDIDVNLEGQVGLAIGRDPPINILGFDAERIGIGYRRSKNIKAIVFIFGFPF